MGSWNRQSPKLTLPSAQLIAAPEAAPLVAVEAKTDYIGVKNKLLMRIF
jgi:hypothetical protein